MDTLVSITYMAFAVMLMLAGVALWLYISASAQDGMVVMTTNPVAKPSPPAPPPSPAVVAYVHTGPPVTTGFDEDDILQASPPRPSEAKTLYAALGVGMDASDDELRTAYRTLAKQWHTDTNRDPQAANEFTIVREAYFVLSDPDLRAKYDAGLGIEEDMD